VTGSLSIVAIFQVRKSYVEIIDCEHSLPVTKKLAQVLLKDLDQRFHPDVDGKVKYSSTVETGQYNSYVALHQYYFFAAFLDPRVRPLLPTMMTEEGQIKTDLVEKMTQEAALLKKPRLMVWLVLLPLQSRLNQLQRRRIVCLLV
jgi:hypothetical protein